MTDATKAAHTPGAHANQAEHAAKGLVFYALHTDKTWSGPYSSRAAANTTGDTSVTVVRFNPHQTAAAAAAEDAASAAGVVGDGSTTQAAPAT